MSEPKIGESYFITPKTITTEFFGEVQQEVKFCGKCEKWNTVGHLPDIDKSLIMSCDCPKPFIRPCHFCGVDVEMVKDSTEGRPVACFDHSYKFTPKVTR